MYLSSLTSFSASTLMTSLVPANDFVEERLEQPGLVGDRVLADVHAALLQRLLDEGGYVFAVRWRGGVRGKEGAGPGKAK